MVSLKKIVTRIFQEILIISPNKQPVDPEYAFESVAFQACFEIVKCWNWLYKAEAREISTEQKTQKACERWGDSNQFLFHLFITQ
jgi:hypothetical protein